MALYKKHGNWYMDYYCAGHRLREKIGPSKRRAEQVLTIRQGEILQGRFQIKSRRSGITFAELADKFLEYSKATKRSHERDEYLLKHLDRFFKSRSAEQITARLVEDYKMYRRQEILHREKYVGRDARDVPLTTINRELAALKTMFNLGMKWDLVSHNPVKGVKFFREDNITERILSREESEALIAACRGPLRDIVVLALNTGMRQSEILNLQWEQVDLDNRYITVTKTKSGKQRKIPLNLTVWNVLKSRPKGGILVFDKTVKPEGAVRSGFAVSLRNAGIKHCRFHDLRHTFATRLVLSGISLPVVKELLGHASIVTTMRYAHPTPESKISAVESLEQGHSAGHGHQMDTSAIYLNSNGDSGNPQHIAVENIMV